MPAKKFIVVSSCRVNGKHLEKGEFMEFDLDNKAHTDLFAPLNHAGRLALATPEVVATIQAEIKADKKREAALNALSAPAAPDEDKGKK